MYSRPLQIAFVTIALALVSVSARPMWSQAPIPPVKSDAAAELPKFDIISVRETHSPLIHESTTADGYSGDGVYLSMLIGEAYAVPVFDRVLGLPGWYRERRFDVKAKVDPDNVAALQTLSRAQRQAMLRQVLEERFQFKLHEEERVRPIYMLTSTGKSGPFLQQHPMPNSASGTPASPLRYVRRSRRGQLTVEGFTMAGFADMLSSSLHMDVVDGTHLEGLYNLQLDWNPDETNSSSAGAAVDPAADKPSIFTAVREQLGLKLTPSKGPVKVWVIDHVELPSDN